MCADVSSIAQTARDLLVLDRDAAPEDLHSPTFTTSLVTFPMCIPTDRALVDDECGCCDMDCPEPCDACPCGDITGRDGEVREGVFVSIEDEEEPVCIPKFASARMVYHRDDVSCFEGCLID
jgi:hypothetical protein